MRNHVFCWRCPKCLIAVVLVNVDLPYWTFGLQNVKHIVAFTAIFSNICTAHAQKRLFMNFRCNFRHRRSNRQPRFPIRVQNSAVKSCQLPRNSAETTCTTSPEQIDVIKLEGYSGTMCNKHLRPFSAILRMRRNGYLWTSGVNLDTALRFADPDFLLECKILAIWRRFPLIFAFYMLNVRNITTSGLFDLLT